MLKLEKCFSLHQTNKDNKRPQEITEALLIRRFRDFQELTLTAALSFIQSVDILPPGGNNREKLLDHIPTVVSFREFFVTLHLAAKLFSSFSIYWVFFCHFLPNFNDRQQHAVHRSFRACHRNVPSVQRCWLHKVRIWCFLKNGGDFNFLFLVLLTMDTLVTRLPRKTTLRQRQTLRKRMQSLTQSRRIPASNLLVKVQQSKNLVFSRKWRWFWLSVLSISDAHQPIKRNDGAAASNSTDRTTQTEKKAISSQETTAKPDPNGINSGVNLAVPAITMAACFLVSIALKHWPKHALGSVSFLSVHLRLHHVSLTGFKAQSGSLNKRV